MTEMTTAEAIVKSLKNQGIDTLYCLPGLQTDHLFNAIYDHGKDINVIHTRHEQGAAYMALGAALSTGKPAVFSVVPGVGLLNASAALATAQCTCAPVLAFSGQIPSKAIGKGYGLLHEIPNQSELMNALTSWADSIENAGEASGKIAEAFKQMKSGGLSTVGLDCAMDVLSQSQQAELVGISDIDYLELDQDAILSAAKLLASAKNPLIVVGGGAQDASEEITHLAKMLQAPVNSNRMGHGVIDSRHYLAVRHPCGHRLWKNTDVVLAIGTRLQTSQMAWGVDDDLKIIHINTNADELGRINKPAVALHVDAKRGTHALIDALGPINQKRASREDELTQLKEKFNQDISFLKPQIAWLNAIRAELPDDGFFVSELTQCGYVARFAFDIYKPRTYIDSGYQGTLGYGFATALGVKVANPDVPVVSINGDGSFMFTVSELATAVLHKIALVSIVFNDNSFGNVRREQIENYGGRIIASDLHNPEFAKMAETFGAKGVVVTSPEQMRVALKEAFKESGPTVIEVPVGEMPSPWDFINLKKLR